MSFTADSVPDLSGRTAVVTGANGGLGLATATVFARRGANVVMAVRDLAKAEAARRTILEDSPAARLELVMLDLASQAGVRTAAARIARQHPRIDILVNNAGVMAIPYRRTEDGFEYQFGANHLGHWTLTALLLPALLAAPAARVVTVTSTAHHFGLAADYRSADWPGRYDPWRAYGRSKLANYHFGLGLQRQFEDAGVPAASLIAHPGLSHSNLQARTVAEGGGGPAAPFFRWLAARTGTDVAHGALPQLRAATDPSARGGQFYGPRFVNGGPPVVLPVLRPNAEAAIALLWRTSERATGAPLEVTG